MKIGFYAYDVGPANMLKVVVPSVERKGHRVIVFPPQERGLSLRRVAEMYDCHSVVIGLSAFQAQEELLLASDLYANSDKLIAAIVLEDRPGGSMTPKAKRFAPTFDAVLAALPGVQKELQHFGYRNVVYKGPPPHWGVSYQAMMDGENRWSGLVKIGRDGKETTRNPKDVIVFVPGSKTPMAVNAMLREVVDAGLSVIGAAHFVLGFRKHPGEKAEKPEEEEFFRQAFAERAEILRGITQLKTEGLNNPQLVGASDVTVFTGGPTESIIKAYLRGRMLYYTNDANRKSLEAQGDKGKWFVAELGAAHQVETGGMAEGLRLLLDPDGFAAVRVKQEEHFPMPESFDTAPLIIDYIEELAGQLQ